MAERLVVLIENDPVLSERLRAVLTAYHLRVEIIHDGNELTLRRDLDPSLIILCIDPKRLGWAICNKIKKASQYRGVPMIVTSQEATEKDFEDHKKLRTRAEEYLHKPFGVELLLEKVASLIGIDPPQIEDSLEEIPIDDASLIEEEEIIAPSGNHASGPGLDGEATFLSTEHPAPYIDQQIADETDAAFAAISVPPQALSPRHDTEPPRRPSPSLPGVSPRAEVPRASRPIVSADDLGFDDVVSTGTRGSIPDEAMIESALGMAQEIDETRTQLAQARSEAERWHEERDILASERDRLQAERKRLISERDHLSSERDHLAGLKEQLELELERLRGERDIYKTESEDLKARAASQSNPPLGSTFSREREYLNLREIINKKDKEILDLRDALDSKERQILDSRDKARELERTRRELDERLLEVEREFVAAREKIDALLHDKEKGLEREKGLKVRLDDAQRKLLRADEEIDETKRRHAAELLRVEEQLAQEKARHSRDLEDLGQKHAGLMEQVRAEHLSLVERLKGEHAENEARLQATYSLSLKREQETREAERQALEGRHARAQSELAEGHRSQLAQLEEQHRARLAELMAQHEAALAEQSSRYDEALALERHEHADRVTSLEARHAQAVEELVRTHKQEAARIEELHQQELRNKEQQRVEELAQVERTHVAALAAAEGRRQAELEQQQKDHEARLQQLVAEHTLAMERLEKLHAEQLSALTAQHKREMDELTQVLTAERNAVAERLKERETDLGHTRTRLAESEAALASLRQLHQEQSVQREQIERHLAQRDERIVSLERENADFQEQILRAYQRIKSDEGLVSRAKRALAVALTLLDESGAPVVGPARSEPDAAGEKEG